jgi:hypothetical protein
LRTWFIAMFVSMCVSITLASLALPVWSQNPGAPAPKATDTTSVVARGQAISGAVSVITSTAVSPLLGVCVLGSYEYFKASSADRARLPAYASPWFWVPVAILLILILVKDTIGGFTPMIKKPLDAVEVLMLNKASLIFIGFPVVFHQVAKLAGLDSIAQVFAWLGRGLDPLVYAADASSSMLHGATQTATETATEITTTLLMLVLGLVAMFAVWLVGHSVDVLILLSPFPFLDLLLKGIRTAVFAVLVGSSLLNRSLGLAIALFVIVVSLLLMGWAFRLAVFGAILAWDILGTMVFGLRAEPNAADGVAGFTARRIKALPKRTYGKVVPVPGGKLEFHCRRLLVGDTRRYPLDDPGSFEIGRGLFQPSIIRVKENKEEHQILFRLLPRYRGSEESLRSTLGISTVRDIRVPRGLKAFWNWLSDNTSDATSDAAGDSGLAAGH